MSKVAALGIDIGGTKTLCVLVDKNCRVLETTKFKTAANEGCKRFTKHLLDTARSMEGRAHAHGLKLKAIGVGCAGLVDRSKGLIKTSPNLLCLEGFQIGPFLKGEFKAQVTLGNDVQLGVCAEHRLGAAQGCRQVLGVFFGTGVGGAAVVNDCVYEGATGLGGQVGAILAQPVGGPEAALSHGILDRIASKAAICSEALVLAIKNWAPYLHKKVGTDLAKVTWGILKRAIEHEDKRVEEMLRARMKVVGIALSSIVNFLDPEMVVLGGGLVDELPKLVLEEVEAGMKEYLSDEISRGLKVRPAKLGGQAVALGAAYSALQSR